MQSRSRRASIVAAAALCALVVWGAVGAEPPREIALPSGEGLAAKYPGDKGMEHDPDVIFTEQFEEPSLSEMAKRWEDVKNLAAMSFSGDVPPGSAGRQSLLVTHVGGKSTGAHLYRRLLPGYEKWFVRFYVKFAQQCFPIHHFFHVGGYYPPTPWPQGGAGQAPSGDERFTVGIEPFGKLWKWDCYTYWMEMRASPPAGKFWGNALNWGRQPPVERGQWTCVELMVKLNSPVDEHNGELAVWIDGRLVSHLGKGFPRGKWVWDKFVPGQGGEGIRWSKADGRGQTFVVPAGGAPFEGFRWRRDPRLKLNFVWLLVYITEAPPGYISKIYFDRLVVAKRYIGPLKPG